MKKAFRMCIKFGLSKSETTRTNHNVNKLIVIALLLENFPHLSNHPHFQTALIAILIFALTQSLLNVEFSFSYPNNSLNFHQLLNDKAKHYLSTALIQFTNSNFACFQAEYQITIRVQNYLRTGSPK